MLCIKIKQYKGTESICARKMEIMENQTKRPGLGKMPSFIICSTFPKISKNCLQCSVEDFNILIIQSQFFILYNNKTNETQTSKTQITEIFRFPTYDCNTASWVINWLDSALTSMTNTTLECFRTFQILDVSQT